MLGILKSLLIDVAVRVVRAAWAKRPKPLTREEKRLLEVEAHRKRLRL